MHRNYIAFSFFLLFNSESIGAKTIIDCRVATSSIKECNPYGKRLYHVKNVHYKNDRQQLIRVKTLPVPEKKIHLKVISVEDMIEKYLTIHRPKRFIGSDSSSLKKIDSVTLSDIEIRTSKDVKTYGIYIVGKGDALYTIAKRLGVKQSELKKINGLKNASLLSIGQKLKVPLPQEMVDALSSAIYKVEEGDTLLSIAKKFNLDAKDIVLFNHIKDATTIQKGKLLKLPLPYVLKKIETQNRKEKNKKHHAQFNLNAFGTHKLRVTATAYTSHGNQTDDTPFLAAWNNRLTPGMKVIAVSRDLLSKYGMKNGTKVRISGLRGFYRVRDKMNKRYRKRIDIYMGLDRRRALRWGRRSVVIYW